MNLLTATSVAKYFKLPAKRVNSILSELGWIEKNIKGWKSTTTGKAVGAVDSKAVRTGSLYVRWPESILNNIILINSIREAKGETNTNTREKAQNINIDHTDFRQKFPAKHRAKDGHYVRSKAELLIDNYLYDSEVVHAYERKLPVEEDIYSDFYIPTKKLYIEFWGYEADNKYSIRKQRKLDIYDKYGFKLIQLTDKEVQNLDDILPRLLLKFGIKIE